jgi:hypothetical protein
MFSALSYVITFGLVLVGGMVVGLHMFTGGTSTAVLGGTVLVGIVLFIVLMLVDLTLMDIGWDDKWDAWRASRKAGGLDEDD